MQIHSFISQSTTIGNHTPSHVDLYSECKSNLHTLFLGYVVEKRMEGEADYEFDHQTTDSDCRTVVSKLENDMNWQFRVKAVNRVGPGRPSEPTEEVLIQDDKGSYFVRDEIVKLYFFQ